MWLVLAMNAGRPWSDTKQVMYVLLYGGCMSSSTFSVEISYSWHHRKLSISSFINTTKNNVGIIFNRIFVYQFSLKFNFTIIYYILNKLIKLLTHNNSQKSLLNIKQCGWGIAHRNSSTDTNTASICHNLYFFSIFNLLEW